MMSPLLLVGLVAALLIHPSSGSACDFWWECPGALTCCLNIFDMWKCCPLDNGVCCSDRHHCCPQGTTCGKARTCEQSLGRRGFPFFPDSVMEFPAYEYTDAVKRAGTEGQQ